MEDIRTTTLWKTMTGLWTIFLVTTLVMQFRISIQQQYKLQSAAHEQEFGLALSGSEYRSFTTSASYAACLMACEADVSCMSLNFLMTTSRCDLNKQTKDSAPACFIERHNSIYSINPAGRTIDELEARRGTQTNPAKSCLEILKSGTSTDTGVYWIDPPNTAGNPIQAYCDMTTDGGGWTIVKRTIQPSTALSNLEIETYEVIKEYNRTDVNVIPTGAAMLDIQQKMGFHQIHFYCYKKSVGRVMSIMTKNNTAGQDVLRMFEVSGRTQDYAPACGSFDILPEDTSVLAQNCGKWGESNGVTEIGKWNGDCCNGRKRISNSPFYIGSTPEYYFSSQNLNINCDDYRSTPLNGEWRISVR